MKRDIIINTLNGKVIKEIIAREDDQEKNRADWGAYHGMTVLFEDGTKAFFDGFGKEPCAFWTNVQGEPRREPETNSSAASSASAPPLCSRFVSPLDVPALISQVLRECEKGDLADFSFLSHLDSRPADKGLIESLIASRLAYLRSQKVLQVAQDVSKLFLEKLREIFSNDPCGSLVNSCENVQAQATASATQTHSEPTSSEPLPAAPCCAVAEPSRDETLFDRREDPVESALTSELLAKDLFSSPRMDKYLKLPVGEFLRLWGELCHKANMYKSSAQIAVLGSFLLWQ